MRSATVEDEAKWLELLDARNLMSHAYDEATSLKVYDAIARDHEAFSALIERLKKARA